MFKLLYNIFAREPRKAKILSHTSAFLLLFGKSLYFFNSIFPHMLPWVAAAQIVLAFFDGQLSFPWVMNRAKFSGITQGDSGRWAFSLHPISSVSFAPPSLPQKTCDLWRWQNLPNESLCLVWLFDTPVPSWHLNEWLQMFPIQSEQFSFSTPPSQM